jgi:hypothetical protein
VADIEARVRRSEICCELVESVLPDERTGGAKDLLKVAIVSDCGEP